MKTVLAALMLAALLSPVLAQGTPSPRPEQNYQRPAHPPRHTARAVHHKRHVVHHRHAPKHRAHGHAKALQ